MTSLIRKPNEDFQKYKQRRAVIGRKDKAKLRAREVPEGIYDGSNPVYKQYLDKDTLRPFFAKIKKGVPFINIAKVQLKFQPSI